MSGLYELGEGKQRLDAMFQDLLSTSSANEKVYDVMTLTKAYHKYKREYVKHLVFTPEGRNLSKYYTGTGNVRPFRLHY